MAVAAVVAWGGTRRWDRQAIREGRCLAVCEQADKDLDDFFEIRRNPVGVEIFDDPLLGSLDEAELPDVAHRDGTIEPRLGRVVSPAVESDELDEADRSARLTEVGGTVPAGRHRACRAQIPCPGRRGAGNRTPGHQDPDERLRRPSE